MNILPSPIRRVDPGDPIRADTFNALVDAVNALASINGDDFISVDAGSGSVRIRWNGDAVKAIGPPVRMRLVSEHEYYVVCVLVDRGEDVGGNINVAKWPTIWPDVDLFPDATTITQVSVNTVIADDGLDDEETWKVTPSFVVGGPVYAWFQPLGGTGVEVDGVECEYVLVPDRQWAVVTEE